MTGRAYEWRKMSKLFLAAAGLIIGCFCAYHHAAEKYNFRGVDWFDPPNPFAVRPAPCVLESRREVREKVGMYAVGGAMAGGLIGYCAGCFLECLNRKRGGGGDA